MTLQAFGRAFADHAYRSDTAASVTHLVDLLRNAQNLPPELRVLDLCTGTGCIPLLIQHELYSARSDIDLRVLGVDISDEALRLATHNLQKVRKTKQYVDKGSVKFTKADILIDPFADQTKGSLPLKAALNYTYQPQFWDILISNPPYVSPSAYWKTTTRSVRGFEPKLALVPPPTASQTDIEQGDKFYPRLLDIARDVEAKVILLEVADLEQALRVARFARALDIFDGIEIWREQPDASPHDSTDNEDGFPVLGQGNARSVICWRGAGAIWLDKATTAVSQRQDAQRLFRRTNEGHLPETSWKPRDAGCMEPEFDKKLFDKYPAPPLNYRMGSRNSQFWSSSDHREGLRTPAGSNDKSGEGPIK